MSSVDKGTGTIRGKSGHPRINFFGSGLFFALIFMNEKENA
jgi:hypothetical protein